MPSNFQQCIFCGGDRNEPNHEQHCDGRQGGVEPDPPVESAAERIRRHRETSIRSFYNAVDLGIIKTRREQVWFALMAIGVSTINEVYLYMRQEMHIFCDKQSITPRFAELRDLGIIREVSERPCRVTGETCIAWQAVPSSEHGGFVVVNRCSTCGQIISRDLPTRKAS